MPDDPVALKAAIADAVASADLVISSGGVSVGDYDYVDRVLADLLGQIHCRSVAVKPGKPLTVATFPRASPQAPVLYFGLPGNPVSALVTFWRFVQPALRKLSGLVAPWTPTFIPAYTAQDLFSDGQRETYLWGRLYRHEHGYGFELARGSHSSGNLINLAGTNGLAVLPVMQPGVSAPLEPGQSFTITAGSLVHVLPMHSRL
ncbi:molybdopterin-binding protein [Neosynechococcus sphagnicola]|uniref:molybdopterin-binding protein n=1 Tax=Neosynechococcus sphagnicola TaxID=1501145 RepID=UPI0030841FE3